MSYKKSEQRKQQILDCAKHLFAERGFQATQIADICEELHIARGTIYQYFENKEDIFRTLISEYFARIEKTLDSTELGEDIGANGMPPLEEIRVRIVAGTEQFLRHMYEDRDIGRIIMYEAAMHIADINQIARKFFDERKERVVRYLQIGIALGLVRKSDPQLIATALQGTVTRVILDYIIDGKVTDESQLHDMAEQIIDYQLHGILV